MLQRLNLRSLKNIDMSDVKSQVKSVGNKALSQLKYIGTRRVYVAGRSVNPVVLGAAAAALIAGTILVLRRRARKMQFAGDTTMQGQMQPAK